MKEKYLYQGDNQIKNDYMNTVLLFALFLFILLVVGILIYFVMKNKKKEENKHVDIRSLVWKTLKKNGLNVPRNDPNLFNQLMESCGLR
jgi:hypothetical protein